MTVLGFNVGSILSLKDMNLALDYLQDKEAFEPDLHDVKNMIDNRDKEIKNSINGEFTSTQVILKNTGSTEANSFVSVGEDTPKVVRPDKFKNWYSLGRKDTKSNIALGFDIKNGEDANICEYWFND